MNAPRLLRGAARVVSGLASLAALIVFVIAALDDHTATATAAAGLCLALAVLAALDLESFEGLGIKAKLRTTLSDAEARLDNLDMIIRSLSRAAFSQSARGNLSDPELRTTVDELTNSLRDAGVSPETIETFKRPVYSYISGRLWYVATLVRSSYQVQQSRALADRENRLPMGVDRDQLREERDRLTSTEVNEHPYGDNFDRFRAIAERMAVETPVALPEHRQIFIAVMGEISDLFEECRRTGNLTDRAMAAMGRARDLENPYAASLVARFR